MTKVILPVRIILYAFWLMAAGAGLALLADYQATKGASGTAPVGWPEHTQVERDPSRANLVMFVHPQCPCTKASMEELNRLMAHSRGKVTAQVWFFRPTGFTEDWVHAALWQVAKAIPGVTPHEDPEGAQARLFGAETSGYVLLYDTQGHLQFKGGITSGRGHEGDNPGEDAIGDLLAGRSTELHETPVYGCSLLDNCGPPTNQISQ